MKLNNKYVHLILIDQFFSKPPNPENYSKKVIFLSQHIHCQRSQNILFKEACRTLSCENLRINMVTLGSLHRAK